jgi:hypothetical protein
MPTHDPNMVAILEAEVEALRARVGELEKMLSFERERCAEVAERHSEPPRPGEIRGSWKLCAQTIATAIRARGDL